MGSNFFDPIPIVNNRLLAAPDWIEIRVYPGNRVALNLRRPLRIDCLDVWSNRQSQIQRQICDVEGTSIEAEGRTCWEKEPLGGPLVANSVEVTEFSDDFAGRIDHDDLVLLVCGHPTAASAMRRATR
jgi:hypothetical protein